MKIQGVCKFLVLVLAFILIPSIVFSNNSIFQAYDVYQDYTSSDEGAVSEDQTFLNNLLYAQGFAINKDQPQYSNISTKDAGEAIKDTVQYYTIQELISIQNYINHNGIKKDL